MFCMYDTLSIASPCFMFFLFFRHHTLDPLASFGLELILKECLRHLLGRFGSRLQEMYLYRTKEIRIYDSGVWSVQERMHLRQLQRRLKALMLYYYFNNILNRLQKLSRTDYRISFMCLFVFYSYNHNVIPSQI